jgi:hypothetical protein
MSLSTAVLNQRTDCRFESKTTRPLKKRLSVNVFNIAIMFVDNRSLTTSLRIDIQKRRAKSPADMLAEIGLLSGSKNGDHIRHRLY